MRNCIITGMITLSMIACQPNENKEQSTSEVGDSKRASNKRDTRMIDGNAGKLFVHDSGDGPAIVFVHSFGGSTLQWNHQLGYFRKDHRVVAFDFRSHGQSSAPSTDAFSMKQLAEDIQTVVDSLKLDRFILVAHSMGGLAAIEYTALHPEKVRGLVLANTPGKIPAEQSKKIIAALESDQYQKAMDENLNRMLENATFRTDSLMRSGNAKIDRPTSVSLVKSMFSFDANTRLKDIKVPKLIITTPTEEAVPNTLHKSFPETIGKVMDGASHWTMIDKATEFNTIVEEFIKTLPQ